VIKINLGAKQELTCWLTACALALGALLLSHTGNVTKGTYWYGLLLFLLTVFLFWMRIEATSEAAPRWLRMVANFSVATVCVFFLLYLIAVAGWFI